MTDRLRYHLLSVFTYAIEYKTFSQIEVAVKI